MEFTTLIHERESVRNYDADRPVPQEVLRKILDAGRIAPSAKNYQPWKFLLISSPEMLVKVKACYRREWLKDAPHILVILGLRDQAWIRGYDGYNSVETDVTIAMTHIILAAENEGVGSCWIAAYDPEMLRDVINPDENHQIFAMTPLGYPKAGYSKPPKTGRKSLDLVVDFL